MLTTHCTARRTATPRCKSADRAVRAAVCIGCGAGLGRVLALWARHVGAGCSAAARGEGAGGADLAAVGLGARAGLRGLVAGRADLRQAVGVVVARRLGAQRALAAPVRRRRRALLQRGLAARAVHQQTRCSGPAEGVLAGLTIRAAVISRYGASGLGRELAGGAGLRRAGCHSAAAREVALRARRAAVRRRGCLSLGGLLALLAGLVGAGGRVIAR